MNRLRNSLQDPRASLMFFVVRDLGAAGAAARSGHSHVGGQPRVRGLLFQTSDTTWHAYNGYGGYTTYGSFEYPFEHAPRHAAMNLSEAGHDLRRAHKRSYNTPLITRDYRSVNTPFANEYAPRAPDGPPAHHPLDRHAWVLHARVHTHPLDRHAWVLHARVHTGTPPFGSSSVMATTCTTARVRICTSPHAHGLS